jgi:hypothetical protein
MTAAILYGWYFFGVLTLIITIESIKKGPMATTIKAMIDKNNPDSTADPFKEKAIPETIAYISVIANVAQRENKLIFFSFLVNEFPIVMLFILINGSLVIIGGENR